ncbi:MAG: hypothetical protein M1514_01025 [Patescibacteria group bacterium]|nr:hypothetical protein [Patescibacteria group bacterium]
MKLLFSFKRTLFLLLLLCLCLLLAPCSAMAVETFNLRVLLIGLNPVENGVTLADKYYGWQFAGKTAGEMEDIGAQANIDAFKRLSGGAINYEVVKKIHITNFPFYTNNYVYDFAKFDRCAHGGNDDCERQKWLMDYPKFITENRICEIAAENNVDEIWMMSIPYLTTWENFMIGPVNGFNINGGVYALPQCQKQYAVMNPGYSYKSFLHIYGHRVEGSLNYIFNRFKPEDKQKYLDNFMRGNLYGVNYGITTGPFYPAYCGNSHFPSNAVQHYDYDNNSFKESNCLDWKNFPDFTGATETINCQKWGCSDENPNGWAEFWLGSLPGSDGEVPMIDNQGRPFSFRKNWWYYILYPQNAIDFRNPPTPTPNPLCSCPVGVPTKLSGNANCDNVVDRADLNLWLNQLVSGTIQPQYSADFNCDGFVDRQDLGYWVNGFAE